MTDVASALIFGVRNFKKAEKEKPRFVIATGQVGNATKEAMKIDNVFGKTTKTAVEALEKVSKQEKLLEYAGKGVKFVGEHINPLLCVSAGIKVFNSDDKQSALIKETAAISAMFAGEALMKKHMDKIVKIKGIDKIAASVAEFSSKSKARGMIPTIIKGAAFVAGSITSYKIGEKIGNFAADKVKTDKQKTDE